ncbi:MAG: hypothetical protein Q9M37_09855 [Desulfonauticus sp.]|nr:hypothetical protein [Desulfonauticus sp.]
MKNRKKTAKIKARSIKNSFTGGNLTNFAGIDPLARYLLNLNYFSNLGLII